MKLSIVALGHRMPDWVSAGYSDYASRLPRDWPLALVELDTSIRASEEDAGIPPARRGRGVAAMLGLARRESPHRAARRLSLAKVTATELPHTWAAWRAGRVTEWRTTLIAAINRDACG